MQGKCDGSLLYPLAHSHPFNCKSGVPRGSSTIWLSVVGGSEDQGERKRQDRRQGTGGRGSFRGGWIFGSVGGCGGLPYTRKKEGGGWDVPQEENVGVIPF